MGTWEKYSSQIAPEPQKIRLPASKLEIAESTHIVNSLFSDIGEYGAISISNYQSSVLVETSVFFDCRNLGNGAAIYLKIEGSASFGLTRSCFLECSCIGSESSIGYSFYVEGSDQTQIVQVEECAMNKNHGICNDGLTVWRAQSSLSFLNSSYSSVEAYNAGSSVAYCLSSVQKYCMYMHIESSCTCYSFNELESFFRCIFDSNNPKDWPVLLNHRTKQYVTSCIFSNCGSNIFVAEEIGTVLSTDCSFDVPISSQSNVQIVSTNPNLDVAFTYISKEKCNETPIKQETCNHLLHTAVLSLFINV